MAYERITMDPNRMSGLPCIRDTRVTVSAVLGQLAAGRTVEEVLADYPYLDRADVRLLGTSGRFKVLRTFDGPPTDLARRTAWAD